MYLTDNSKYNTQGQQRPITSKETTMSTLPVSTHIHSNGICCVPPEGRTCMPITVEGLFFHPYTNSEYVQEHLALPVCPWGMDNHNHEEKNPMLDIIANMYVPDVVLLHNVTTYENNLYTHTLKEEIMNTEYEDPCDCGCHYGLGTKGVCCPCIDPEQWDFDVFYDQKVTEDKPFVLKLTPKTTMAWLMLSTVFTLLFVLLDSFTPWWSGVDAWVKVFKIFGLACTTVWFGLHIYTRKNGNRTVRL